ncbi:TadE-like protein [Novipirellula galeiformis]|uniref:TadE-like protein n=1 Tax=Novipirellula galeiformis TaxID=2528004 RepID=A0A5C6CKS1_9BACT|nr:TadE/TadG family type IV pilus assembly protein [Novipirellula galeiformis]TWU23901.1 TadE-like protein [Novipirellula galeiformis]
MFAVSSQREFASAPRRTKTRTCNRVGAVSVEFSLVAIPMFLILFAAIELGRGMMTVQALEEAARSGCRIAVLKGSTTADIDSEIHQLLSAMGSFHFTTQTIPAALDTVPQWDPVTVRVSADFADMTWLPVPRFLAGMSYTASCVLPREAEIVK